ncbi:ANTAR domain-containing protein [Nocardioides KLBMP 9356]|uniref:ANTAR domain-containing protein n=1 Tax=Nocardioides potassii TaxID=2911371 RepID=A0ABS9HG72_9ACTN|nr:ANTAR domain-containing protein [Nocardioides potassii]MCF6379249.1 ANTAR domain-containing protein [Nocardioides potassii]
MEPIPETLRAIDELDVVLGEHTLLDQLRATADRARQVAPGLVGVSIASRREGITFTLVATDEQIAALDAVQYVASGPCVDAMDMGHGIATSAEGLLDEDRWQEFARASAAHGVQSTLTLPVIKDEEVVATVNLYGRAADTFVGVHKALAEVFDAWAPGVVANADLSFTTRTAAQRAPADLRALARVEAATGIVAARNGISVAEARRRLDDAALRADVPVVELAIVIIDLHHTD